MPNTSDAVDQAQRLGQIGFPEFTSKLVSETFQAVVSAMIRQEQTYADIVKKVAMTEEEFADSAIDSTQVSDWLHNNFPGDGNHATAIRKGNQISKTQGNTLHETLKDPAKKAGVKNNLPDGKTKLKEGDVDATRKAVKRALAKPRQQALEELVEKGVLRVVLNDGTIRTDLDFHTHASQHTQSHSRHHHENDEHASISGNFVEGLFGIGASAGGHHMSVSTRTSEQQAESSADVDIQGHVELNLEGDFQPLQKPQTQSSDSGSSSDDNNGNDGDDNKNE